MNTSDLSIHMKNHYEAEEQSIKKLLHLEELFRQHHVFTQREMKAQKDNLDRMLVLTQYYEQLNIFPDPCCKKLSKPYEGPKEPEILNEYCQRLNFLKASNCRILEATHQMRTECIEFEDICSNLDLTVETPLILGDTFHKPISFFRELVADLFKYFHALTLKLKSQAYLLEPEKADPLKLYLEYVIPSEDFDEYLQQGLVYCKCLRPQQPCRDPYKYRVKFEGKPPFTTC